MLPVLPSLRLRSVAVALASVVAVLVLSSSRVRVLAATQLLMATGQASHLSMFDIVLAYQLPVPGVVIVTQTARTPDAAFAELVSHQVDLSVTSRGLNASQAAAQPAVTMFPLMASAVVPCYRLDSLGSSAKVALPTAVLAQIFLGAITSWNDSRIAQSNPLLALPDTAITVVLEAPPSGVTLGFTQALSGAWPAFNSTIGVTDSTAGWSSRPYAASRTGLILGTALSLVLAVDGSIGFAGQASAISAGVQMADMINALGQRVSASTATVNAAATDKATNIPSRSTQTVDLTNSVANNAWPIVIMSYAQLDTLYTPAAGCRTRYALVQFLLWYYQAGSTVVSTLLGSRQAVPVPPIVLSQMALVAKVGSTVYCNGSLILPATQPVVRVNSHGSQAVVIGAQLTSAYAAISNITFQAFTQTDVTVMNQMMASTVDLGFLVPQNINASAWSAFVNSREFLIFPLYQLAVSLIFNFQLTPSIAIPATQPVLLTMAVQIQIFHGCINSWADPALTALNPWLPALLNGTAPPIIVVTGCGTSSATAPLLQQLLVGFSSYVAAYPSDTATHTCLASTVAVNAAAALQTCGVESVNENTNATVQSLSEAIIPALVNGYHGAIGYVQIVADATYGAPQIAQYGVVANSTLAGLAACVAGQFDPATLATNVAGTRDPTCWPMTQQLVAMVRRRYYSKATNTSSCVRGLDALVYMRWVFTNDNITPLLEASNFLRIPSKTFPAVSPAYVAALNSVLCDDSTLLITLPTVWSLSKVVSSFAIAFGSLGLALTVAVVCLIGVYYKHPVIRSASPTFMLMTMLGILCLFLSAIVLAMPPTVDTCYALNWLWNLGFDLTFAPLFAKTWRIYQIFGRKKLSVIKITNSKLTLLVAVQLAADLVLLATWQAIAPLQPYLAVQTVNGVVHNYTQCGVDGTGVVLFSVVCVAKGVLLLFGALMAFSTREVSSSFNESGPIALSIYNVVFSVGIIVPIALLISALGDILLVLQLFLLLWVAYFSLTALAGTKVLHVYSLNKGQHRTGSVSGEGTDSVGRDAFSFASLAGFSTLPLIQAYVGALKDHLKEAETKATKLKAHKHAPGPVDAHPSSPGRQSHPQPARPTITTQSPTATAAAGRASVPSTAASPKYSVSESPNSAAVVPCSVAEGAGDELSVPARHEKGSDGRRSMASEAWVER